METPIFSENAAFHLQKIVRSEYGKLEKLPLFVNFVQQTSQKVLFITFSNLLVFVLFHFVILKHKITKS